MPALTDDQRTYLDAARAQVSRRGVEDLLREMVAVASPTGHEGTLASLLVDRLGAAGLDARYQALDDKQGNAIARLSGDGSGAGVLLYGHLDTHLTGEPEQDAPAADGPLPKRAGPRPYLEGDVLFGLGAGNPKGYSACMAATAMAVARAQVPLRGDLVVGLAGGGMPANAPAGRRRRNVGQGAGVTFMLQQGTRPDFAVIGKPGHAVGWEEVGVCCFRVRVRGRLGYAGTRHVFTYKNSVVDAARVIVELEPWLDEFARRNTSGYVAPQGIIGAISGGWPHKPTFIPAWTDFYLDLRVSPRSSPNHVERELRIALEEIAGRLGLDFELTRTLAIPGSHTDPGSWIVQSCIRAFEEQNGPHRPISATSGATDAAILRMWGVPTARFGMPSVAPRTDESFELEMDSAHLPGMLAYIDALLYVVIDTCCRERGEVLTRSAAEPSAAAGP